MARIIKNSKLNPAPVDETTAAERAADRQHTIAEATKATTGNAGLDQGNAAKSKVTKRVS